MSTASQSAASPATTAATPAATVAPSVGAIQPVTSAPSASSAFDATLDSVESIDPRFKFLRGLLNVIGGPFWRWLSRQEPITIVALGLLVLSAAQATAIGYAVYWSIQYKAPEHLAAIQAGYERIQKEGERTQEALTERYLDDKRQLREVHTKELNQITERVGAIADRMEAVAKGQESLIRELVLERKGQR